MGDDVKRFGRLDVAKFLAQALGQEKAVDAVDVAANELGLGSEVSKGEVLLILDRVARVPGIVGISARFAKVRALLL